MTNYLTGQRSFCLSHRYFFVLDNLNIKHLMTGAEGNSEFCFRETLNVPLSSASGNIKGRGETKLTVSRGASH